MVRRSESQFKIDDRAYPIRVKFVVPAGGMSALSIDTHGWLRDNLSSLDWAWGTGQGIGYQVTVYYFRKLEDARRFVDAFPQLELADGVASPVYSSPARSAGPDRRPLTSHTVGPGPKRS